MGQSDEERAILSEQNSLCHCDIHTDDEGTDTYKLNGVLHRVDGPAIENKRLGIAEHYFMGEHFEEPDYEEASCYYEKSNIPMPEYFKMLKERYRPRS